MSWLPTSAVAARLAPGTTSAVAGTTSRQSRHRAGSIGTTVTEAVPLCPSIVAMTAAWPAPTAVTTPVAETVATASGSELHVTARPVITVPVAERAVAVAVVV
ncbi:MAG: hypothetical protein R2882_04100 [Gemmatimonadales bacterium]